VDVEDFVIEKQNILDAWDLKRDNSCEFGTEFHLEQEEESYITGICLNPFDNKHYKTFHKESPIDCSNATICQNLYDLEDGYYPELLIHHPDEILCGQSDKVFIETVGNIRYVDIDDYKTNEKISKSGMWNEDEKRPINFLEPISHIPCSKFH